MRYHLSLLGGFECYGTDGRIIDIANRKARALLAYLLIHCNRPVERDTLATLLWEESGATQARANLRKTLSRLRQALPEDLRTALIAQTNRITLTTDLMTSDIEQFERLAKMATPETLEQADTLYQGEFLHGFSDSSQSFEDWLSNERRRFDELFSQLLQRLFDHYVVSGAIDRAIQLAVRLLGRDPLQETLHRQLMQLYLQQDRIGSALEQYRRCCDILKRELGMVPSAETERIRALMQSFIPDSAADAAIDYKLNPERDDVPERASIVQTAAADRRRRRTELTGRPSLAVLCFSANTDDAESFQLGENLAEDLTTTLGRFRELDVLAPSTVFAYREAAASATEIGAELGVSYICEGRIRMQAGQIQISPRLVEVASGRQLWAERYDIEPSALLTLQDDIIKQIGGVLIGRIEHDRLDQARRQPTQDWQAYDYWLRGRSALRRSGLTAIEQARRYFQQALACDPEFARAYVGLAMAQLNEWGCFSWNHWVFMQTDALELAHKAVALDDQDHQAHCILGMTQLYRGDYDGARQRLLYAIELNPNDADVLAHGAAGLALVGEHQPAVEAGRRALRLSPYHPEWYTTFAGIALFAAREYEEAIATMASAPEAICNTPAFIAACYAHLGQPKQGVYYRDTVQRHYRLRLARGALSRQTSCVDWLLAMDPFREPSDLEHYAIGLRQAGFE